MAVANFAQTRKIFGRRNQHAVGADHRLDDHGGDIMVVDDHVLHIIGARDIAGRVGVLDRAVVAVHFRAENHVLALGGRLGAPSPGIARGGDRRHGRAVIGTVSRQNLASAGVQARNFQRGFVGFRT